MMAFLKPHFRFSMLLLMPLLRVLWHVAGELLWPSLMWRVRTEMWPFIPEIVHSWE